MIQVARLLYRGQNIVYSHGGTLTLEEVQLLATLVDIPITVAALIWALRLIEQCSRRMDATITRLLNNRDDLGSPDS
jgi:hypothetical protein